MATFIGQKNPRMIQVYCLACFSVILCIHCVEGSRDFEVPKPTKTQAKWLDYEVGAIVHFNMQTFDRYMKPGKRLLHLTSRDVEVTMTGYLLIRFPTNLSVKDTLNSNKR